jgi:hypothetical protein
MDKKALRLKKKGWVIPLGGRNYLALGGIAEHFPSEAKINI